jgi:hypothetical protein
MRDAICLSYGALVVLWWIIFCTIILPRCDFTGGQLMVTILWVVFVPSGAATGLILGIGIAAHRKAALAC